MGSYLKNINQLKLSLVFLGLVGLIGAISLELLPNASPGIGTGQLIIIVISILLIIISRFNLPNLSLVRIIGVGFITLFFMMGMLEILFILVGQSPMYSNDIVNNAPAKDGTIERLDAWVCDEEVGCRYNVDHVLKTSVAMKYLLVNV